MFINVHDEGPFAGWAYITKRGSEPDLAGITAERESRKYSIVGTYGCDGISSEQSQIAMCMCMYAYIR